MVLVGRLLIGLGGARGVNRRYIADTVPVHARTFFSAAFVAVGAVGMVKYLCIYTYIYTYILTICIFIFSKYYSIKLWKVHSARLEQCIFVGVGAIRRTLRCWSMLVI
jgi:hypothetical protein